jgi:hypothetical protein
MDILEQISKSLSEFVESNNISIPFTSDSLEKLKK